MPKKKAEPNDAMTGPQLQRFRKEVFALSQPDMAKLIGVAHRTYIRLEGYEYADVSIPLHHAKHVRCLMKALKSGQ